MYDENQQHIAVNIQRHKPQDFQAELLSQTVLETQRADLLIFYNQGDQILSEVFEEYPTRIRP